MEQRLNELERPTAHLRELTGQTLPVRIYASRWFHRMLPAAIALRLAALRGLLEWYLLPSRRLESIELTRAIRGVADERGAPRRLVEDACEPSCNGVHGCTAACRSRAWSTSRTHGPTAMLG